ncbi:hypothetical protein [Acetobacter sp. DsW_063]|uniref:hypothetical protein n=1 Tax=Acetobacter sp. DsW_063 TaxID=1514894 RepID=UPI000B667804|nr:hypothetical protein [Acetobacter sp. DsW_063]OUJ11856.1 hypothetical protein HK28_04100 [Acetobacter sp. DsW_063]
MVTSNRLRGYGLRTLSTRLAATFALTLLVAPSFASAQDADPDEHKGPDMHQLAAHPSAPPVHKDYSHYLYRPHGDRVQEQPDLDRLLFWTPDGKPDGYAQRRGESVIYYDAAGRAIRVQRLAPEDLQ